MRRIRERGRARRHSRSCADEAANALMVEGMFIALLLVVSLGVLQFGSPPPSTTTARPHLERDAGDALQHFAASRDPNGDYARLLDRAVAEALQGNTTLFDATLKKVLPTGAPFNVLLDNGEGTLRLRWARDPTGEAVSAQRPWSPPWETILAAPTLSLVDGAKLPLQVQGVPVHRALGMLDQPGVAVQVSMERADGVKANRSAFAPLLNASTSQPGVRIGFLDSSGGPVDVVRPAAGNDTLYLRVEETQGRAVAAGTVLEVRVPPGFRTALLPAAENTAWTSLAVQGNATYGWVLQAKLVDPLSSGSQMLRFNVTRPTWGKVHTFDASLGGGAIGRFTGAFVADSATARGGPGTPPAAPIVNFPRTAPWSSTASGGVVVIHEADSGTAWSITSLSLHFTDSVTVDVLTGTSPASGWVRDGSWLNWTGTQTLAAGDAAAFRFDVRARAAPMLDTAAEAGLSLGLSDGSNATLGLQRAAGVFSGRAEARNGTLAGYPSSNGTATASVEARHQGATLRGTVAFNVTNADVLASSANDLGRGLAGSWLAVDTPSVALGDVATVRWDLTSLTQALGLSGVTFQCYTDLLGAIQTVGDRTACNAVSSLDWQYVHATPAVRLHILHPSPVGLWGSAWPLAFAQGSLDPSGMTTFTVPLESLQGTHAVAIEADVLLEHRDGTRLTERVTLLGALDVHRAGQPAAPGPLYDVIVQAWMPDWG